MIMTIGVPQYWFFLVFRVTLPDNWCFHLLHRPKFKPMSRDSAGGIATGYGMHDRGVRVRVPVGSRIFSSPRRTERLLGPPSLLSNGYRGQFPRGVKLSTHLQLVPRSRKRGSKHPLPHTPLERSA
jgi:hypothetical protein